MRTLALLLAVVLFAGCATAPQPAKGPHCPVCAKSGAAGTLCLKCQAIYNAEGQISCPECGQAKSGTWCAARQAFHFSDDGSKCCGKRRGAWDNAWGCGKFVGLETIVFCADCEQAYPRDGACPKCGK